MKKKSLLAGIVLCVLLAGILASCGMNRLLGGLGQIAGIVRSEDAAKAFLDRFSDQFGENFSAENGTVTVQSVSDETLGERSFYCYSPTIDGIPVVGSQIILSADRTGIVTSLSNSYNDAVYEADLSPAISAGEAEELARQALGAGQEASADASLVLYAPQNVMEPALMYIVRVQPAGETDDGGQVSAAPGMTCCIYANGQNAGEIYQISDGLRCAEYSITYQGYTVNVTPVTGSDGQFQLADPDRGISIFKAFYYPTKQTDGVQYYQARIPGQRALFSAEDSILGGMLDYDFDNLEENAVALLSNLSQSYDYYQSVLNRYSYDGKGAQIAASYGYKYHNNDGADVCSSDTWRNAAWYGGKEMFLFGTGGYEYALDVTAHEFTHAVIDYACGGGNGLGNSAEAKALNESMSDIMGSLIEGKSGDGKWVMGEDANGSTRSLSSPDIKHYDAFDPENDEHDNSGIYTYAAYLMMTDSRTAGISDETWARVFYLSMFMLPSDAVMTDGRQGVLEAAAAYGFTETQLQAVRDAFDAVGIAEPAGIRITLTSADGTADLSRVSLNCVRRNTDGTGFSANPIQAKKTADGEFLLSDADTGAAYQITLYYDAEPVKTVILDNLADREYVNGITEETIDLSIAWLDIVVTDQNGSFVSGTSAEVWAEDDANGIAGLVRNPSAAVNGEGEPVYRLPVTPGRYGIRFPGTDMEDTADVRGDVTLTYVMEYDLTAYGEVVRQYESKYGTLKLTDTSYGVSYTGVFLLELLDFDGDGAEELLIGYSIPHPDGVEDCTWPYLDVWRLENGEPVRAYEGAVIDQSDIGKHCAFTLWNGTYYLITGMDGYARDLSLLTLEDGVFQTGAVLKSSEEQGYTVDGAQVSSDVFYQTLDQIRAGEPYYYHTDYQYRCFSGKIYEDSSYTADSLLEKLNAAKELLGVEKTADALAVYADVVRQYEDTYGTIDYNVYYQNQADQTGKTYMLKGVCLLEPIDFDGDSVSELVIGYGETTDEGTGFTRLYADVWGLNGETPVLLYSKASFPGESYYNAIAYKQMDGAYYLLDGEAGERYAQTALCRLAGGQFEKAYTVKAEFPGSTPSYTLNGAQISAAEYVEYLDGNTVKLYARFMDLEELEGYQADLSAVRGRIGLEQLP